MAASKKYSKPTAEAIREALTPLQYHVTQQSGTEPPFRNLFWDAHEPGLFVDVVTGEPLFSSRDKFDSGTGWPSFSRPVEEGRVVDRSDASHGMRRVEVRSQAGDSHLGHLFDDGPAPTGMRYCINSASLRFVPLDKLDAEGYGAYRAAVMGGAAAADRPAELCAAPGSKPGAGAAPGSKPAAGAAPGVNAGAAAAQGASCETTLETAVLAGGCFWGMQELLRKIPGVVETEVGYTGGTTPRPVYKQVKSGTTGHAEAVRILFDPRKLAYADLLENWFFKMHDPTTENRQGNDRGTQYRSAIFFTTPEQAKTAAAVIKRVDASGFWPAPLVTEVVAAGEFTRAEEFHQDYLQENPGGYTCHFIRRPAPAKGAAKAAAPAKRGARG